MNSPAQLEALGERLNAMSGSGRYDLAPVNPDGPNAWAVIREQQDTIAALTAKVKGRASKLERARELLAIAAAPDMIVGAGEWYFRARALEAEIRALLSQPQQPEEKA